MDHAQRRGWSAAAFAAGRRFSSFSAGTLLPHSPRSAGSFSFQRLQLGKANKRAVASHRQVVSSCRNVSHVGKKKKSLTSTSTILILPRTSLAASCGDTIDTWHEAQRLRSKRLNGTITPTQSGWAASRKSFGRSKFSVRTLRWNIRWMPSAAESILAKGLLMYKYKMPSKKPHSKKSSASGLCSGTESVFWIRGNVSRVQNKHSCPNFNQATRQAAPVRHPLVVGSRKNQKPSQLPLSLPPNCWFCWSSALNLGKNMDLSSWMTADPAFTEGGI